MKPSELEALLMAEREDATIALLAELQRFTTTMNRTGRIYQAFFKKAAPQSALMERLGAVRNPDEGASQGSLIAALPIERAS